MNEYQALLEELKSIETQLCPPQKEITEEEHLKAQLRLAFETLFDHTYYIEKLLHYVLLDKSEQNLSEDEFLKLKMKAKDSLAIIEKLQTHDNNIEPWEVLFDKARMEYFKDGLTDYHYGDCTGHSSSCNRCLSETYYKLPTTVDWEKAQGSSLNAKYLKLSKDKKQIEQAMKMENDLVKKDTVSPRNKI